MRLQKTGQERRASPRYAVNLPTHLSIRGAEVPCRLVDISASGALLQTNRMAQVGDKISVDLPGLGPTIGNVVRITKSHLAVGFPGLLVINDLIYNMPHPV
ncbi:MAG: PilZ domain-containing protein [Dongiaceae bacterium]